MTPKRPRRTPYENISQVLAQRSDSPHSRRVPPQPEFLEFREGEHEDHFISFTEDRRGGPIAEPEVPLLCPDTLDEMLNIVSSVRQGRMDVLRDHQVAAARSYVEALPVEQAASSEGSAFPSIPSGLMGHLPRR